MKYKLKNISRRTISTILCILMMLSTLMVGSITTVNANNEYGKQYLYVDMSACTNKTLKGINAYWDYNCSEQAGWQSSFEDLGGRVYKFDLSPMNTSSYTYFRGFKVVWTDDSSKTKGVIDGQSDNCLKVASNSDLSWTTYKRWAIKGSFDNWTDHDLGTSGVLSTNITIDNPNTFEFLVYDRINNSNFYRNKTFTRTSNSHTLVSSETNAKFTADVKGTYKFTYNVNTKNLVITYPQKETKYQVTVKSKNSDGTNKTEIKEVGTTPVDISTAESYGNYTFSHWTKTDNVTITNDKSASTTIKATGTGTVTANYTFNSKTDYYLVGTFNSVTGNGDWTQRDPKLQFSITEDDQTNAKLTLELAANSTYKFQTLINGTFYGNTGTINDSITDWDFNNTAYESNCTLNTTVAGIYTFTYNPNNKKLSVTYPSYTVTIVAGSNGSVSPSGEVASGTTIKATPNAGYAFEKWVVTGNCSVDSTTSAETEVNATGEGGKVTAQFVKLYKVEYSAVSDGSITCAKTDGTNVASGTTVKENTDVKFTITPNVGYEVDTFKVNNVDKKSSISNNTYTHKVTENINVQVTFKKKEYSITYVYNPTQGGTSAVKVNGNTVEKLHIGDKFTVAQTVNTAGGYAFDSVVVNAGTATLSPNSDGIYTMTTGNVTVTTTYKAIKPTISNCPTETIKLKAGATYTIPATTNYGKLTYSALPEGFTFSGNVAKAPNEAGTYTITVTATNQPEGITTAATTTANFDIVVEYTETQTAYKKLEESFAKFGHENADYYDTANNPAKWAAYENAVNAAATLLATFPLPTATNTADYTNAQTTLENAYEVIQGFKNANTIYVLSKYAPNTTNAGYVNIHMFNSNSEESYDAGEQEPVFTTEDKQGNAYAMTNLGTVKVGNDDKYLYKFEFFGKGDFVIYVGENSNSSISNNNKLTGDVKNCKDFKTYYLDLKDEPKGEHNADYTSAITPYDKLSVTLGKDSDKCVEDTTYDLTTKITKTEGGTLKVKSGVTVTHTYTDTFNDTTTEIKSPTTWIPTEPGIHTITITSSTGVETVTNTFTLYVQDKLDKPVISINGRSDNEVTVNIETDVTITVASSGKDYPEGVKYIFTVDGTPLSAQSDPTLTYSAGVLKLGNHTVSVQVIAPDTTFGGTTIPQYVNSGVSDEKKVIIETVKYRYTFDFTKCNVATNNLTYTFEGKTKTCEDLRGTITVDKDKAVVFEITMLGNYKPIPNEKCWSGVTGGKISTNSLSYSFTASTTNAGSTIVFKSFLPAVLSPESQDIKIGSSAKITIGEIDNKANYQLLVKKENDTEYSVASATLSGNEFTTSNLAYGKYTFKVRQYVDNEYEYESKEVNVNSVIGTIVLKYYYREYKKANGLSYDPYIGIENNLEDTLTEYTITLEQDISTVIADGGYVETYEKYAPDIKSNYFKYILDTTEVTGTPSEDNSKYTITITGEEMKPEELKYSVSIDGEIKKEFSSYYQQKTFMLNAADYCDAGDYGFVWYYVDSDGNEIVVSTSQYYKLRVARNTNLKVKGLNTIITTPTTTINDPVYNEIISNNAVKVQMNMLVENYLPKETYRTKTGVVYCAYEGDTAPTINSTELANLIANSSALDSVDAGTTCTVGTLNNGTVIKGYFTANDNANGKFIFGPIAKIDSPKTYVVYSYLTYTQNNVSTTIVSNPVTASVKLYKAENTSTT